MEIKDEDTFVRPMYAGNGIATVKSNDSLKIFTVRGTAFEPANSEGGSGTIEPVNATAGVSLTTWYVT